MRTSEGQLRLSSLEMEIGGKVGMVWTRAEEG